MTFRIPLFAISCLVLTGLRSAQAADVDVFGDYSVSRMKPAMPIKTTWEHATPGAQHDANLQTEGVRI